MENDIINHDKNGLLHGFCRFYRRDKFRNDGFIINEGYFFHGKRHKYCKRWDENGILQFEEMFEYGIQE